MWLKNVTINKLNYTSILSRDGGDRWIASLMFIAYSSCIVLCKLYLLTTAGLLICDVCVVYSVVVLDM